MSTGALSRGPPAASNARPTSGKTYLRPSGPGIQFSPRPSHFPFQCILGWGVTPDTRRWLSCPMSGGRERLGNAASSSRHFILAQYHIWLFPHKCPGKKAVKEPGEGSSQMALQRSPKECIRKGGVRHRAKQRGCRAGDVFPSDLLGTQQWGFSPSELCTPGLTRRAPTLRIP